MTTLKRGTKGRIYTGARARLSLAGKYIGYARNVNGSETIQYEPINVLDNIEVEEWVPVGYLVTLTFGMFRIIGATLKSEGLFPDTGIDPATHLENILNTGDITAQLEDTKTKKIISSITGVKISGHNFSVDARGVVGEDVEVVATRMMDESEITGLIA